MPANVALTPTELAYLLLSATTPAQLSFRADDVLATATIATTPLYPCFDIAVTGASAGWVDVLHIDRICKIESAGGVLRGYYRITSVSSSSEIHVAEIIGDADGGLFADQSRTAGITSGDTIKILARRDIDKRRTSIDDAGIIYADGTQTVGDYNTFPEPILAITINGEYGDYAVNISSGTVHIVCVVNVTKWPPSVSGGSTLTYAWFPPSAATNITGNLTATCEFDLPAGAAYEVDVHVTDTIGHDTWGTRTIWLHNSSYPPVAIKIPEGDERDRAGRKCKIIGPQAILGAIPPGAKVMIWGANDWGGQDVSSATKKFSGFMISRPYDIVPGYHESQADVVGPMGILEQTDGFGLTLRYTGSQTTWNELASDLSTVQFVMWWLLRWRAANVLRCFDFTPLNTSNLTGRRKDFTIGPAKLAAQLQQLAARYDTNIGCRSEGGIIHAYLTWMLEDRSGVVTRDMLDYSIYQNIRVDYQPKLPIRPVQVAGYYSDLVSDTAVTSFAPGEAPEPTKINDKIYDSVTDCQLKAGREYAHAQNPFKGVTVYLPVNRDVYEPADMQRVPVIVPAAKSPTGVQITLNCLPNKVQKVWLGGKRAAIRLDCDVETDGKAGIYVPPPFQATTPTVRPPVISTVNSGWGNKSRRVPTQGLALTIGGDMYQVAGIGSVPVLRKISPTAFGADVGEGGRFWIQDPYRLDRIVVAWAHTIAILNGFNTCAVYPDTPWTVKYTTPGSWFIDYVLRGSINRQDYFAWWESDGGADNASRTCRIAVTFDNFATVQYNYLPGYFAGSFAAKYQYLLGLMVGSFNTNSSGLLVASTSTGNVLIKNTNWGLGNWDLIPNSGGIGTAVTGFDGLVGEPDLPYSNPDGSENRNQDYIAYYAGDGGSPPTLLRTINVDGTIVHNTKVSGNVFHQAHAPGATSSFTLNCSRKYMSEAGHIWRTDDNGDTWIDLKEGRVSLGGSPVNPDYVITSNKEFSINGGVTWTPITILDSIGDIRLLSIDLSELYDVGGVHPTT